MSKVRVQVFDFDGTAAQGMNVLLEFLTEDGWEDLDKGVTDSAGQIEELLLTDSPLRSGIYRVCFDTRSFLQATNKSAPYPYIPIVFEVSGSQDSYGISLKLAPTGYSNDIVSNLATG
jgi:5-hydroxyisourate hydrolase